VQRVTPPFAYGRRGPNTGARFNTMNHDKLGCTLNLKSPRAIALVQRLADMSDVVVENFSPGTMDKLGLGHEALRERNPRLIYLSASAFGHTGPWSAYGGFHSTVNAMSGFAQITGYPAGPPRLLGAVLPDTIGGIYITLALLVAVMHQKRTGAGCRIDYSMLEGLLTIMPQAIIDQTLNGRECGRVGNADDARAPHGIYRCLGDDEWVAISIASQGQWQVLCEVAGRPDWLAHPDFVDEYARQRHRAALDRKVEAWTMKHRAGEISRRLQAAGIAAGPASTVADLLSDPHLRERGFVVDVDHPEAGRRTTMGLPWRIGGLPTHDVRHAPLLGEHNSYVFKDVLGLSDAEIDELTACGAIE
jgi:benzylsuccinate CoA-transferase BbsF subunit